MRYLFLLFLFALAVLPHTVHAQYRFDKTSQDLGTLTATSERAADFVLTNYV